VASVLPRKSAVRSGYREHANPLKHINAALEVNINLVKMIPRVKGIVLEAFKTGKIGLVTHRPGSRERIVPQPV